MGSSFNIKTDFMGDYITVKTAAELSGYNQQYLRRMLRGNVLESKRLGQLWLIERSGFILYLSHARQSMDKRFGPQAKQY
jgi:excisionase family DNA binding protein